MPTSILRCVAWLLSNHVGISGLNFTKNLAIKIVDSTVGAGPDMAYFEI